MTTPSLSVDTPRGRMYRLAPGEDPIYPSITTVVGMRQKEFLQGWHGIMAGRRAMEMFEFLERNPERASAELRRITARKFDSAKKIAEAAPEYTRQAADFGTLVHALCEDWEVSGAQPTTERIVERANLMRDEGCFQKEKSLPDLIDRVQVRLAGFGKFITDFQPEFVYSEQTVVNHEVGYAGTTDAIVKIGGALLSGDIKTSKKVHGDYALQAVAVVNAEAMIDDEGNQTELPHLAGGFIIHLPKEGGYRVVPLRTSKREFDTFKALRAVWSFTEDECLLPKSKDPKQLLLQILSSSGGGVELGTGLGM